MKNLKTFESFSEEHDFNKYYYLLEDILILEGSEAGSVNNPNSKAAKMIRKKAKQSGISSTILKQVYRRGRAAWNSGHSPGASQVAWATGRVNSFITGEGGARKADSDLWSKVKKSKGRSKASKKRKK